MANTYVPNPEELGRRRFPDNKPFRKELAIRATDVQSVLQSLLPSSYIKEPQTNLGIWYRSAAREVARQNLSVEAINRDKQYLATRARYLQQVLGERLFLSDRIAPVDYNDEIYREYLLSIKSTYLAGSKKRNIEALASEFTKLPIRIKELYLEARDPGTSLSVVDTHKMVVDVIVDDLQRAGYDINRLKSDLDFFINLTRPAHVLYDTRLIWTETYDANKVHDQIFGDTGGGCVPVYNFTPFSEPTYLAQLIFVLPSATGATGQIESINTTDSVLYLSASSKIIVVPGMDGTKIFDQNGRRIMITDLQVLQNVRIVYQAVPGSFQYWYTPAFMTGMNWYAQFYPDVYRRPAFQESVKKLMEVVGYATKWSWGELEIKDGRLYRAPAKFTFDRVGTGRFPLQIRTTETTLCDRWAQDAIQPLYEDLRTSCYDGTSLPGVYSSELRLRMGYPRLSWPYARNSITDTALLGDPYIAFMPEGPLTDGASSPATPADVIVTLDGTSFQPLSTDASTARVALDDSTAWWSTTIGPKPIPGWDATIWSTPVSGNLLTYNYHWLSDGTNLDATRTNVFGIGYWQMPHAPLIGADGTLASISNVSLTVDGTAVPGAVTDIHPLLGHVMVSQDASYWQSVLGRTPVIGDVFRFAYKYGERYQYPMVFDDVEMGWDTYLGGSTTYGLLFDVEAGAGLNTSMVPGTPLEIGYRYRSFFLPHSSVLNSPDTLNFNTFQKPANRASIINQCQVLNHQNEMWSAEFLYDTSRIDKLSDRYLMNGLDPVVKLREGTPPFQKTFGYQPHIVNERKPQDVRTHHHPLMYSDLLLKEFPEGGGAPLSVICDANKVGFKVGLTDGPIPLNECPPWILFDTLDHDSTTVSIPGDYIGVPNLRITDYKLRQNFILNQIGPSGTAVNTYTVTTDPDSARTVFWLPAAIPYDFGAFLADFPALPVMKDATTLAGPSDVTVTYNGSAWSLISLDPLTGRAEIAPFPVQSQLETQITLTQDDINRSEMILPGLPLDPTNITLTTIHGTAQYYGLDYYVHGRYLSWAGGPLEGLLAAGDQVRVSYSVDPLVNATFTFTYRILSSATIEVLDELRSRMLDNRDVFDGGCYDEGMLVKANLQFEEFPNFLDDGGEGIKLSFFNPRTAGTEDHVFSGPVFETWVASEDQIGPPEGFPDSLVRVGGGPRGNPLTSAGIDYSYLGDRIMRFRKKTFQELMPDRTFRTTHITEVLPV